MSTQPILISVPPATELERILYATDFSLASERALPIVSTIARQYGSQVFLAHIWTSTPYSEPYMSVMPLRDEEKESRRLMMDLLRRPELANLNTTIEIKGGDPVERINEYVQRHGIGLVVIGTHGWSGFTHKMMGSVAEELLRTLKCAVLTIGPNLGPRFAFPKTIKGHQEHSVSNRFISGVKGGVSVPGHLGGGLRGGDHVVTRASHAARN